MFEAAGHSHQEYFQIFHREPKIDLFDQFSLLFNATDFLASLLFEDGS